MPHVQPLSVGQLKANCYLIFDDQTKEGIIIDPGDEADFIIQKIIDFDVKPLGIIATHCHFDHIMAVTELKLAFKIPFLAHKDDEFLLERMRKSAIHFTNLDPGPPPKIDNYLETGNVRMGPRGIFDSDDEHFQKLKIIETPGHTPGSVSIYIPKHTDQVLIPAAEQVSEPAVERMADSEGGPRRSENLALEPANGFVFVGDINEVHTSSDKQKIKNSIKKILSLPGDTIVYPGHGEPTSIYKLRSQFL